MQKLLDQIISENISFDEKIIKLKTLFKENNIMYFSDFDDTLSTNDCVFFTKVKLLRKFKLFNEKHINKLIETFKINQKFPLQTNTNFIIISRNKHSFLKKFYETKKEYLQKNNIKLAWVIWNDDNFKYSSLDKLEFLNENNIFIWDSFENKKLQNYSHFINVEKMSKIKIKIIETKKIFILIKFVLKWF